MIGIAKLIDMGAGVNQLILTYSSKYRSASVFVVFTALINVVLNYFLITNIGILGAALATCLTTYIFQLLKYSYVAKQFGIHPFSTMTVRILALFVIALLYYSVFPNLASPILEAVLYCAGLVIIYVVGIRVLGIQSDITEAIRDKAIDRIQALRNRFS